jgi:GNAT superfamily N-acetyltransferase
MLNVQTFTGNAVGPYLDAVAELRIAVFRDWPYLYDGTRDYEKKYLATYARSPESLFVLALEGERVIGASTGIPLIDETAAFQQPFIERGIALADVFYFGESVLLKEYRGRGLGHRFFDEREAYARRLGRFTLTAFCAVERDAATRDRTICSARSTGASSAQASTPRTACGSGCAPSSDVDAITSRPGAMVRGFAAGFQRFRRSREC